MTIRMMPIYAKQGYIREVIADESQTSLDPSRLLAKYTQMYPRRTSSHFKNTKYDDEIQSDISVLFSRLAAISVGVSLAYVLPH